MRAKVTERIMRGNDFAFVSGNGRKLCLGVSVKGLKFFGVGQAIGLIKAGVGWICLG